MSSDDIPACGPECPATFDNLLEFVQGLVNIARKDGSGWENLRFEMVNYACTLLKGWQSMRAPTIRDLAPRIWAFYCGYIACHQEWAREIETVIEELPTEPENGLDKIYL